MLSAKRATHFREFLTSRMADLERTAAAAQNEAQALPTKEADPADQAAVEYERQVVLHRAAVVRNMAKTLALALER